MKISHHSKRHSALALSAFKWLFMNFHKHGRSPHAEIFSIYMQIHVDDLSQLKRAIFCVPEAFVQNFFNHFFTFFSAWHRFLFLRTQFWTPRTSKVAQTTHSEIFCLRNIFSHPRQTNIWFARHSLSDWLNIHYHVAFYVKWWKCASMLRVEKNVRRVVFFCFSGRRDGRKINLNSPHHFSGVCFSLPTEKGAAETTTNLSARFWLWNTRNDDFMPSVFIGIDCGLWCIN